MLRPEGLKNEENGSNFDAGRFLKSADGSIAGNIRLFQTIPSLIDLMKNSLDDGLVMMIHFIN